MSTTNIIAITDVTTADINRLITILKARDTLFAGDVNFLSASVIEYHYEELEELLRENGYNGGKLIPIFYGTEKSSLTYALYDTEEIEAEKAMTMVRDRDGSID